MPKFAMNIDDVAPALEDPGDENDPRFIIKTLFNETIRLEAIRKKWTIRLNNLNNTILNRNKISTLIYKMNTMPGRWTAVVRIIDTVHYEYSAAQGGPTRVYELGRAEGRVILDKATNTPAFEAQDNRDNQPDLQFQVYLENVESDNEKVWTEFSTGVAVVGMQKNTTITFRSIFASTEKISPRTRDVFDDEDDPLDEYKDYTNLFVANIEAQDGCLVVAQIFAPED